MEVLEGRFVRFRWQSDDGAFGVGVIETKGAEHTIVGGITASPGDTIKCHGNWVDNPKFGRQFKVKNMGFGEAKDRAGIVGYLDRLPNIGPTRAAAIFKTFGQKTFEIIELEPQRLVEAPGITARMVPEIHAAFMAEKGKRDLIVFLKKFDLTDGKIAKIMATYGRDLKKVLKEEPYRMIEDIHGFGWKIVDAIALAAGQPRDGAARIRAGIQWVLSESEGEGNTFLPRDTLFSQACKALQVPAAKVADELGALIEYHFLIDVDGNIYLPGLYQSEVGAAESLFKVAREAGQAGRQEATA